jgi:DUF1680 family protein
MKKNICFNTRLLLVMIMTGLNSIMASATESTNVAPDCIDISASYTANWNNLYAINNGVKGFGELANSETWGSWDVDGNRPSEQWLRYTWMEPIHMNQVNVYFWTDTDTPGDNVHVPASWTVLYWDETLEDWKEVTPLEGEEFTCTKDAVNSVKFQPVTTSQLKLVMQAASNGTYFSALGVTEWEVMGVKVEEENPYTNVALNICDVTASYTADWNYLYAVYDGTKGFGGLPDGKTWGSYRWSERPAEEWICYTWTEPVEILQSSVYFWTDTETPGDNVHVPASWVLQYWDETAEDWTEVTLLEGEAYTCLNNKINTVNFKPVRTSKVRLYMQAAGNGTTYSALGVGEWEVYSEKKEETIVYGDYPITNVDFSKVHLSDNFWNPRMEQNQTVTIPVALQQCYDTRRVLNFQKAAAILRGENIGYFDTECTFDDTDIYKILEGMAYSVQAKPNAQLDKQMDELIEIIAAAQEPDGYLYTPRTAGNPAGMHGWVGAKRWEKTPDLSHELYNSGHLFEAATAHFISTGKRTLLDIAIKNADLLVKDFLEGGLTYEPGHQIVEMGLVKMYRVTGNEKYLKLAKYFLDLRGQKGVMRQEYSQTHRPIVMQDEAVGHAVRAAYMYSGMADIAAIMNDKTYLHAVDEIWHNVVEKKYYITGGIGARHAGEAFGVNYELPNLSAYCETCAAIANVYWNWRMFLLHGDSKYYDVIERTLYNGVIAGIGLDGKHFFYPNPLESDGTYQRSEWFGCACCPSNLCRFTASVPGYIYAHHNENLYVNLYIQGTADIDMADGTVTLTQTTNMPWEGAVSIEVDKIQNPEREIAMMLRLPGWANGQPVPSDLYSYVDPQNANITVKVNGEAVDYTMVNGYMTIKRTWAEGDVISFELPMDAHKTVTNELVVDNTDKMSIERGPIVYCIEWPENDNLQNCFMTEAATAQPVWTDDLNGLMKLSITEEGSNGMTAIPYYAWANRGMGDMKVWIPRSGPEAYEFHASEWTTGDVNRIPASSITYDEENNIINAESKGNCNICLMLDYGKLNYNISKDQKYLVVRGSYLSTNDGDSYLWWLNGINKLTSISPEVKKRIIINNKTQTILAWNLAKSGINDNLKGDNPNITIGQTIFGMTSTVSSGQCKIYDINFVKDINEYIDTVTSISDIEINSNKANDGTIYDLSGRAVSKANLKSLEQGIYIKDGKKFIVR